MKRMYESYERYTTTKPSEIEIFYNTFLEADNSLPNILYQLFYYTLMFIKIITRDCPILSLINSTRFTYIIHFNRNLYSKLDST